MNKKGIYKVVAKVIDSGPNPTGTSLDMEIINGLYATYAKVYVWRSKDGDGSVELVDKRELNDRVTDDDIEWLDNWVQTIEEERKNEAH